MTVDRIFQALSDPTRRALVARISQGPASVSRLAEQLPVSLAAVVQHLQILEESGLVHTQKTGRIRLCSIEPAGLALAEQWIASCRSTWERRFDRLGEILAASGDDEDAS